MNSKLVTIVMPVYNRENTVVRTLDSIGRQDAIDYFTLIVVDNASTDKSADAVMKWRSSNAQVDMKLVIESKKGAAVARNAGLSAVMTPYVMFFDSDDEMLSGHLRRLVEGITRYPDADILGWKSVCELPDKREYVAPYAVRRPLYNQLANSILSTEHYAVRTDFIRKIGGWCERLNGWDDYELGVRLVLAKPVMVKLPEPEQGPLVKAYFTGESITGNSFSAVPTKWEDALDIIEDELKAKRPEALGWVGFRRAVLAGMYEREGARDDARRLLSRSTASGFGFIAEKLSYHLTRMFGRGARYVASIFMPTNF